jgi:hypothetical protein
MTARFILTTDGETAMRAVTEALVQHGFRVMRSFDLRSAVTSHHECACPHHGTEQCTCQYVVLLAYAASAAPVVITAHGRDAVTEVQVVEDPNAPSNPVETTRVKTALGDAMRTCRVFVDVQAAPDGRRF